jgi:protein-arginine kinase activator protein McsA
MVYEDIVECESCGVEITYIHCGRLDTKSDPDYYVCESCVDERDATEPNDLEITEQAASEFYHLPIPEHQGETKV